MRGFAPFAIVKNIPPGSNDPSIIPVGVVLHVRAGTGDSLFDLFKNDGGIESQLYVRFDGTIEQYRSIFFEADAQFLGNSFELDGKRCGFVSVETEGLGEGEWTKQQIASIKQIITWVKSKSDFPLRVCPAFNKPGVGYHRLFTQWNPNAHSCPGPDRVKQFDTVLIPWMKEGDDPMVDPAVQQQLDRIEKSSADALRVATNLRDKEHARFGHTKDMFKAILRVLKEAQTPTPKQLRLLEVQIEALLSALEADPE